MSGNIVGPIGGLIGIGVMAYTAKKVVDVTAEQAGKKKKAKPVQQKQSMGFDIDNSLNKMLGR